MKKLFLLFISLTYPYLANAQQLGFFDLADCNNLLGWVADKTKLNQSISIDIYDGSTLLVPSIPANISRPDVGAFLGDNGLHGFVLTTPGALKDGDTHKVSIKFAGTTTDIIASPKTVMCQPTWKLGFGLAGLFIDGYEKITVDGTVVATRSDPPTSPGACSVSVYALDTQYLYFCITNPGGGFRWARVALTTQW